MYYNLICDEFNEIIRIMKAYLHDVHNIEQIERSAKFIVHSLKNGNKILACGNGGSHCNAMHFSEELTGRYRDNRVGYAAIAISDPTYLSCVSNDFGYEYVFSRYVESLGKKGDVLFAISTSGFSINILNAIKMAFKIGMKIIFLTGDKNKSNNEIFDCVDLVEVCVPSLKYSDHIQEIHIKIIHIIVQIVEKEMRCNHTK